MENNSWVIYDGELIRANKPVAAVESRGLMYGDGCFETFRVYQGSYFKLDAHLNRLREGVKFLGLDYPKDLDQLSLERLIDKLLQQNKLMSNDAVIRIQIWREGARGYNVQANGKSHYAILAAAVPQLQSSVSLATVDIKRIPDKALPSRFKLCNNINYITAANQARQKGADDALMQTIEGFLSETTIANLFWITGNTIFTPSIECDLLPGITRNILIDLIESKAEVKVKESTFRLEDILNADAAWICNSVREVVPISRIDDHKYGPDHPFFVELNSAFKNYRDRELNR